jgi:PAS domain S-box-containing protein
MSSEWRFLVTLNERLRPLGDPNERQQLTLSLLGQHLAASRVHYARIDGDDFVIGRAHVNGVAPLPMRGPVHAFGRAIVDSCHRGTTIAVPDARTDTRLADLDRAYLLGIDTQALIAVPLTKHGRWIAVFAVHSRTPRVWTRDEIALVEVTAEGTWGANERARAEAHGRANEARLTFLLRLNDSLSHLGDPSAVQETAAKLLAAHLDVSRVGYAEVMAGEYAIRHEHTRGVKPLAGATSGISIGGELRESLRRGEAIVVSDVNSDPRLHDEERGTLRAREIAAFIGVALFKDGHMVAAFGANHSTPRVWTSGEIELVRDVAARTWDAVERTRAEAALRAQEERLRLALDASAGGSWTWIAATNQSTWDDRFRVIYGLAPDTTPAADVWPSLLHPDDRAQSAALLNEVLSSPAKTTWEHTFRILRPDGRVAWIQSRGRAERDANGQLVRLTGVDFDFTRHRENEEALQARRDAEHDYALRVLLETAAQGIIAFDSDGIIVSANRAFETMFGWESPQLVGQPLASVMPLAFRDEHDGSAIVQIVGRRRDGSTIPIEVTVNYVATPTGDCAYAFITDITERQRAAAALRERTAELEYRTNLLSQMASDLTLAEQHAREQIAKTLHDGLQQLLVIVAMNLEQEIKDQHAAGGATSEFIADAKQHVNEAIAAARSLNLELFPPALQRAGLPGAFTWLAAWMLEKYRLQVDVVTDPQADSARKDVRTLLFESVRELLFNAVKHAGAQRASLTLALDDRDHLCITVIDDGVGFDTAKLDDRSNNGRVGWGLFSIRERLTLLGGQFDLDSAIGCGTRIRLVAPRHGPVAHSDRGVVPLVPVEPPPDHTPMDHPDALRILIVDDHPAVRSALDLMLRARPQFSVVGYASNGIEAIAHAHTLKPDIILMDVAMPHMDGIEATSRIHAELPAIKIFGLSMQASSDAVRAIELAGASAFFAKGTETRRLIDHLLALHASRATSGRADS